MPTPAQVIRYSKIAQYLAALDVAKGVLFGPRKIPISPQTIYMERKALEWLYNIDPTNSQLQFIANYVFSLLRGYGLKAQVIANGTSGGGSVIPPVIPAGYEYTVLQFIVPLNDLTGTPSAGNTIFQNPMLVGAEQFWGMTVDGTDEYVINGQIQLDNTTGLVTRYQPYIEGQVVVFSFLRRL